jgi:glyoxylase-like metal-dependent hydrolase (beta-lactamase superfamily II)
MAQIFPLSEGVFTIGHDKIFVPFNSAIHELNERPKGSLLVEVQPFLVITQKDVIVLDCGLGFKNEDGQMQIHENLLTHGIESQQVTKVLLSHLHKDHAGGVVYQNENGLVKTTFPNADYFIYRNEAEQALEIGYPSFVPNEMEALIASGQVKWLDEMEGSIDDYIHYYHSGGHSKEHIVFLIEDGNEKIFFGGDEAPQLKQMKIRYIARYDYDGKRAMNLREQYAEQGKKEGWQFLFYHDVQTPNTIL